MSESIPLRSSVYAARCEAMGTKIGIADEGAATTALQEPIHELASVKAQIVTLHAQMQRDLAVLNMEGVLAANETLKGLLEKKEALSRQILE